MVVLGGAAVSYARGTPVVPGPHLEVTLRKPSDAHALHNVAEVLEGHPSILLLACAHHLGKGACLIFSGFGFRVSGFRFLVSGFGFRVSGFECRGSVGFGVPGSGFRAPGSGFRLLGFEFRVSVGGVRVGF